MAGNESSNWAKGNITGNRISGDIERGRQRRGESPLRLPSAAVANSCFRASKSGSYTVHNPLKSLINRLSSSSQANPVTPMQAAHLNRRDASNTEILASRVLHLRYN